MVHETSEQKRLKDRVALPLLIKYPGPLIDGFLAVPMRNLRAAGDRCRRGGHDSRDYPAREEGGAVASLRCAVANGVMLRSSVTLKKWHLALRLPMM